MRNFTQALVAPSDPGNAVAIELVRRTLDTTESNVGALATKHEACAGKFAG
jgi:hypothetical protein